MPCPVRPSASSQRPAGIQMSGAPIGRTARKGGDGAQQHHARHAGQAEAEGSQKTLDDGGAEDAVDGAAHGAGGGGDEVWSVAAGDAVDEELQPGAESVAREPEEEGDEKGDEELDQAAGDAEEHGEAAFGEHAQIGAEESGHDGEVGGPGVPGIREEAPE